MDTSGKEQRFVIRNNVTWATYTWFGVWSETRNRRAQEVNNFTDMHDASVERVIPVRSNWGYQIEWIGELNIGDLNYESCIMHFQISISAPQAF